MELRFGLGAGHGAGPTSSFDTPSGAALGARVDAGWWVSPDVTFGVHLGWAAFEDTTNDPANTPHHATTRYSYLQAHATLLWHWNRLVAGGGIGLDRAGEALLETDGMSRTESESSVRFGVHAQLGVDLVRVGPGMLGVFGVATIEPVTLQDGSSQELSSVIGGIGYALER